MKRFLAGVLASATVLTLTVGCSVQQFGPKLEIMKAAHDLWIDNGRFKALEINFLQFVKGSTGRASLRVEFSRGKHITAPRNAEKLDLNKIFESMTVGGTDDLVRAGLGADRAKAWAALIGS